MHKFITVFCHATSKRLTINVAHIVSIDEPYAAGRVTVELSNHQRIQVLVHDLLTQLADNGVSIVNISR